MNWLLGPFVRIFAVDYVDLTKAYTENRTVERKTLSFTIFCSANFLSFSFRDILLAGLCIPFTLDSEIIHLTWNLGLEYCISYRWAIPVGFQDLTQFRYLWFIKWEILLISSEGEVQFLKWNNDLEQTKAASHQSSFEKCNDVQDSLGAYDVIPSWFL